ncbi:MAG: DUF4294 domain-containing protein [Sediminibacterium sp.]|nr:DUF4294 domain-containing protein [Sediminibacterium sp.]
MRKHLKFLFLFSIVFLLLKNNLFSQTGRYDTIKVQAVLDSNGDIVPFEILPLVEVWGKIKKNSAYYQHQQEMTRLRNAVFVTYPYAVRCAEIIKDLNKKLIGVTSSKQRKEIIKSREKELRKEFTNKLKKLSIYQGRVLMKLIYRETENNAYEIIKEYRGGFLAFFSQSIIVLFGGNLKLDYDALKKDQEIEKYVKEIEKYYKK